MSDDQVGCEWVSVSSGTGLPGLSRTKAVKRLCVCVCVCTVLFHDPNLLIDCKNFRDLGTFSVDFYCTMLCICGIRCGPVSMSVSVCHKSVLY